MRHLVPISGKDSLAAAIVQTTRQPDLDYEFFYTDTGAELPETYAWLAAVEDQTGWRIERIGADLKEIIRGFGGFLPSPRQRYCTARAKIRPMERWIGNDEATVYYGLRNDEDRVGYRPTKKGNIHPAYPLYAAPPWPGLDLWQVWSLLERRGLLPPSFFWAALHERVCDLLAADLFAPDDWEAHLDPVTRHFLFSGRTRANCTFCFFQRLYEFVWLAEAHPDLFDEAASFETEDYTWRDGFALPDLLSRRDEVLDRRAREVARMVKERLSGGRLADRGDTMLAATSCGLLCGK